MRTQNVHLTRQKQRKVCEACECEGGMAGGKRAPAVVEEVRVWFGAEVLRDEGVWWCATPRFAASEEVWPWAANSVFDHVSCKGREGQACQKAESGNVGFVGGAVEEEGVEEDDCQWNDTGVEEEPWERDAFVGGVWVLNVDIVEEEHAVEGLEEELHLCWVSREVDSLAILGDTYK